jgi:ABC-type multidrug transport system fused ATPase/permease subunit
MADVSSRIGIRGILHFGGFTLDGGLYHRTQSGERNLTKKPRIRWSVAWSETCRLVSQNRGRLALGLILMLISRLAGLVLPATSKLVIDEVIGKHRHDLLPILALAAGAAALIDGLISFGLSQVLGVAAQRAITNVRRSVEAHILRLPVGYFNHTQTGALISRIMTDAEGIRNLVGTGLVQLVGSAITGILAFGILFYLNWEMTLAILVVLAFFGGAMGWAFKTLHPIFRDRGRINAEVTGRLAESLGGIRTVKAYVAEKREQIIFTRGVHRLLRNVARTVTGVAATTSVSTVVVGIIGVIIMLMGGRSILAGNMTVGDLIMYVFLAGLMASPLMQISSIGTQLTEALAGLDRIHEIRQMTTEAEDDEMRVPLPSVRGDIAFENVTFEYDPGVPVLKNVSFRAPSGSVTALVGSSGSGKSTLIGLAMAFYRPRNGKVTIDGADLQLFKVSDYRSHLGVVMQDNFLFDGTIGENIRFSRPQATREEVYKAGQISHCEEFVEGFEQKYDTVVGERGIRLSGGQRQRVAIARAILANPRILILDEATSSLDSESEAMIQAGIQYLTSGRTTFVIAHRLSTIRSADQILVLEQGEIVEHGTHRELLAQNGRYRQLYDKQYALDSDLFVNPGEDFSSEEPSRAPVQPAHSSNGSWDL